MGPEGAVNAGWEAGCLWMEGAVTDIPGLATSRGTAPTQPNSLGVGFLQQRAPELAALLRVHKDQLPVLGGQPVVHHHVHPLPILPELGERRKWKMMEAGVPTSPPRYHPPTPSPVITSPYISHGRVCSQAGFLSFVIDKNSSQLCGLFSRLLNATLNFADRKY